MRFANRLRAAYALLERLEKYRGRKPLIVAIPRGAAPMAAALVNALGGDLDVALVHKISHPKHPEFALGAATEWGDAWFSAEARGFGFSDTALEKMAAAEIERLRERRSAYSPLLPPADPQGRHVIVVDDGVATGATARAALSALRARRPASLAFAAPLASRQAVGALRDAADELIILSVPEPFRAVSEQYDEFEQVSDDDVIRLLSESRKMAPRREALARGLNLEPESPDSHPAATP